ncbi:MAG: aminotransferase class V-fold PLP-dependent enzyme [Gaiellales bacterium]
MRDQLPALDGVAYLNTGTCGPVPAAALDAMQDELRFQTTRPRIGMPSYERLMGVRDRARAAASRVVGGVPDEVVLTGSTSTGVGLAVAGIDWRAGDRVLTTSEEHPGVLGPLDVLSRRHGVAVQTVEAGDVVDAVTADTRAVVLSHVLWTTGRVLDLPAIAEAAHAEEALLIVDGAQSAGNIAVDVHASDADLYAFSGQKWLLGPQGSGGLWVHPRMLDRLQPVLPSYFTFNAGAVGEYRPTAARFDPGTIDPVTLAGLAAAIEWVDGLPGGRAAWIEATAAAADRARTALRDVPRVRVVDPGGPASALIALDLDGRDPVAGAAALAEQGVLVRSIPGTSYIRVSIGAWVGADDLARLTAGLEALPAES